MTVPGGLSEAALDVAWAPPCTGPWAKVTLYGGAQVTIRPLAIGAVLAFDACLIAHDYKARPGDTGAYVCRDKRGQPGVKSKHAYGGTIDLNWQTNPFGSPLRTDYPPALRDSIKKLRTNNGKPVFGWGGDWSGNKDAMHWQPACGPADLATGIDPASMPDGHPAPHPQPTLQELVFYAKHFQLGAPGVELNPAAVSVCQAGLNRFFDDVAKLGGKPTPAHVEPNGQWDQVTQDRVKFLQVLIDHNELGTMGTYSWNALFPPAP